MGNAGKDYGVQGCGPRALSFAPAEFAGRNRSQVNRGGGERGRSQDKMKPRPGDC